jgi:hypothetical protein
MLRNCLGIEFVRSFMKTPRKENDVAPKFVTVSTVVNH